MPKIELINVTKTFDDEKIIAVDNISFVIEDGEYIFLLGPSGCGKTTTLKIIAGLENCSKGTVLIDGKDMKLIPPEDRDMGFVFQNFEIFEHMTVWENVAFGLEMRGYNQRYIIDKVKDSLTKVGLLEYAEELPTIFGNANLQKLGIARAIATGARILIMDEPLGSLDPQVAMRFKHEIRNLIKDLKLTAIQVTHNQEQAMSTGDKIVIMRKGKILQIGTPYDLYEHPNSIFVANFLGETNFFEGSVFKNLGNDKYQIWIRLGGPKINCHSPFNYFDLDDHVVLAFRFEDVYLFPMDYNFKDSRYKWENMSFFEAKLEYSRFMGSTKRFYLKLDNDDKFIAIKPGTFEETFKPGDMIKIGIHIDDIFVFKAPEDLLYELSLF